MIKENSELGEIRHDWEVAEIQALLDLPFFELMDQARQIHRKVFPEQSVQMSTLLSIKTGACPEDCKYCSQSGHYHTGLEKEKLLSLAAVTAEAEKAVAIGASRFCMGAAWRSPPASAMPKLAEMIQTVKGMGLETCMTLGMLDDSQTQTLKAAGLDYYNHNLDTSPEYYGEVISTRTYAERLETLARVRESGMKVCCGGILGMGESRFDRASLLQQLANLPAHPESVPINMLVKIEGTPMCDATSSDNTLEPFEFIRTVAAARIIMPKARVRLSAGRTEMSDEMQAWCFYAGANSVFYGDALLTTDNPQTASDRLLFDRLGIAFAENDFTPSAELPADASVCQSARKIPCQTVTESS
jgi:biotin synthase